MARIVGVAAVVVAALRSALAVTVTAVFLGAAYLLGLLVTLLGWPAWVARLSVFGAFGHPYSTCPR